MKKFKLLNGAELSDGDIVETKMKPKSKPIRGKIYWCKKRLQFRIEWLFRGVHAGIHDCEIDHINYEVLGNVRKTPELWVGFQY